MSDLKSLSVIIIHDDVNVANRLLGVMDATGYVIHAQQVATLDELNRRIHESSFDLIFAAYESEAIPPATLLDAVKGLFKDIPVLFITDEVNLDKTAACIKQGGKDLLVEDHDQHFLAVVGRELANRLERVARREIERRYHATEKRCLDLMEDTNQPIAIIHDSMLVFANKSFGEVFGYDVEDLDCLPVFDLLSKPGQRDFKTLYKEFTAAPEEWTARDIEILMRDREGSELEVKAELNATKLNGENCLELVIVGTGDVILGGAEEESPTTLVSRQKFLQLANRAIHTAHQSHRPSGLLCVAFDELEARCQQSGIEPGDALVAALGRRLTELLDDAPIVHAEANQWLALVPASDRPDAARIADQLCHQIAEQPIAVGDAELKATCSIGVSLINDMTTNADLSVRESIETCHEYLLESPEGNGYKVFRPVQEDGEIDFAKLLDQAFTSDHLQLLFQPIQKLTGGALAQYSVLLGIKPDNAEAYPENFIQMASRNRDNEELDRWVILGSLRTLIHKTNGTGGETLHIQLCRSSLLDPDFTDWLKAAIEKSKIPAGQLCFQLRELDISTHLDDAARLVNAIKEMGCHVCIGQFGLTVQPLKVLAALPVDCVKIDGLFSLDAQKEPDKLQRLTDLIAQVNEQKTTVIVPMIESASILPHLWKAKVAYVEGYYIQAPEPEMNFKF